MIRFISRFSRKNIPFWGYPNMSIGQKAIILLIHSSSRLSLVIAYCIFQSYMKMFHKSDDSMLID